MKSEIKKLWIDALESGDYSQAKDRLKSSDNKFCCLGVLCDLYAKENNIPKNEAWQIGIINHILFMNMTSMVLPDIVMKWSGVKSSTGDYFASDDCFLTQSLSKDNDMGISFRGIAQIIEKYF